MELASAELAWAVAVSLKPPSRAQMEPLSVGGLVARGVPAAVAAMTRAEVKAMGLVPERPVLLPEQAMAPEPASRCRLTPALGALCRPQGSAPGESPLCRPVAARALRSAATRWSSRPVKPTEDFCREKSKFMH